MYTVDAVREPRALRILRAVVVLLSLSLVAALAVEGWRMVATPFLFINGQWEGLTYIAGVRVLEGKALYPDFATQGAYYCYGPLVPMLYAAAMWIAGPYLVVAKGVTALACAVTLAGLFVAGRGVTRSRFGGLLAMGLFPTFYKINGYFFMLRPEIFAVAFGVWGLVAAARFERTTRVRWAAVAALLIGLMPLCKQNFALLAAAYLLWLLAGRRWRALAASAGVMAALAALTLLRFNTGEEHLLATTFALARMPHKDAFRIAREMCDTFRVLFIPGFLAAASLMPPGPYTDSAMVKRLWAPAWAAAAVLALPAYAKFGGGFNSFMLSFALCAVLAPAGVAAFSPNRERGGVPPRAFALLALIAYLCLMGPRLWCSPWLHASPMDWDMQPAHDFVRAHRDSRIYFPRRNYVTFMAAGQYDMDDTLVAERHRNGAPVPEGMTKRLQNGYYDYVIDGFREPDMQALLEAHYRRVPDVRVGRFDLYVPARP